MAGFDIVRNGESYDFEFAPSDPDESIEGWTCNIQVRQFPSDAPSINRFITATNNVFSGFLTSTETAGLSEGTYRLTGLLIKASTDEQEQQNRRFAIAPRWAFAA